jgi:hypothetical protein
MRRFRFHGTIKLERYRTDRVNFEMPPHENVLQNQGPTDLAPEILSVAGYFNSIFNSFLCLFAAMENLFSFDKDKEASNTLFAIPKKGRLYEKCMKLLEGAGLDHNRPQRLDVAHCINLPVTLVFLPAADIASYVGQGNVDMGITGIDVVQEADEEVETIMVSTLAPYILY